MTDAAFAKVENWTQAQCDAAEAKHRRERDEKQTGLMLNYRAALSELDTIGKGIANKTAYYMNELVPADSRGSREAVGKAYLADMPLAGGKARLDYERKRAKEAKNDLEAVIDNKSPNFKEFNAKWGNELANNSYFALSFMVELKGAGLDRNMRKLLGNGWREGAIDQDQFMENIGSAYIIASGSRRDSDFDEATPATAAKWRSTSWFPELRASKMHEALGKAVQSQSARHTDAAAMAMTSEYLNSYVDLTGGNRSSGYQLYDTMNKVIQTKEIGNDLKTSRVYISNIMSNNINDVSATFESNTNTDSLQKGIAVKDGHISLRFNFNSSKKGFSSLIDELAKDRPGNLDIGVARSDNGKFVIHDQNKLNYFKTKPTALQRIILASINESGSQVEKNIGGRNTTSMEKIAEGHSNLLKYVTGADSTVKGEIAKHKDDINSFMASAAEAGLGLLPLPGGPIVSRIGSFGLSQAGGQLMETIFPTDNQAKALKDNSNTNDYVEKLFNQSVTRSIIKRADYHDISTPSEYGIWYAKNYGTNVNDIKFWYTDSSGSMKLMDPEDIKKCNPNTKAAYYDYIN